MIHHGLQQSSSNLRYMMTSKSCNLCLRLARSTKLLRRVLEQTTNQELDTG